NCLSGQTLLARTDSEVKRNCTMKSKTRDQQRFHVHRHLYPIAIAHDAQVNNLAGLEVARAILEVHKVTHPIAIDPDYHIVVLTEVGLLQERHCQHRRWKKERRGDRQTRCDTPRSMLARMQSHLGGGTPVAH